MKVAFAHDHIFYKYNDQYYSNGGLSGEVLERYTANFEEVVILTRQKNIDEFNGKLSLSSTQRVEFVEVPNFKTIKTFNKIIKARKIIEAEIEKVDCVIARISSIGFLAADYAIKMKKPYIVEVVACSWDSLWNYGGIIAKIYAIYSYLKTKALILKAPYVVYVTNEFLQKRYPTSGITAECSNVMISSSDESIIKNRLKRLDHKKEKIVLGSIGALSSKYKGFDTAIKAISTLRRKAGLNIEYRLLGGGDNQYLRKLAIKNKVEDIVKFDGTLPSGGPVFNWLDNIDIYIHPSRTEGLPRAVIEAMSRGCPVIGSDAGGIPELLDENCIFKRSNYKQLAGIICCNAFNRDWLKANALRNFDEAKKYEKDKIELRRNEFFNKFISDVKASIQLSEVLY